MNVRTVHDIPPDPSWWAFWMKFYAWTRMKKMDVITFLICRGVIPRRMTILLSK
jgi:hypothetical protein